MSRPHIQRAVPLVSHRSPRSSSTGQPESLERAHRLQRIVDELHLQGCTYRQIAAWMGVATDTVRRYHYFKEP